jgi:hypothetical protein
VTTHETFKGQCLPLSEPSVSGSNPFLSPHLMLSSFYPQTVVKVLYVLFKKKLLSRTGNMVL